MIKDPNIRIIALKCPNCGSTLRVSETADRAQCEHCGGNVLIVDAGAGKAGVDTGVPDTPEAMAARKRVLKIVLWGTAISVAFPIVITAIVSIILAVVFLLLGLGLIGLGN